MAYSTVPAVMNALVTLTRAEITDEKVEVIYGQPDHDIEDKAVIFGFTGVPNEAAVEDTRTVEQITRERDRERYDITGLATSWMGQETDIQAVVEDAFLLLDKIAKVIATDHTLGGACGKSRISFSAVAPVQSGTGAVATIQFVIAVDAFTGRPDA